MRFFPLLLYARADCTVWRCFLPPSVQYNLHNALGLAFIGWSLARYTSLLLTQKMKANRSQADSGVP
jgi:hypothetical protein